MHWQVALLCSWNGPLEEVLLPNSGSCASMVFPSSPSLSALGPGGAGTAIVCHFGTVLSTFHTPNSVEARGEDVVFLG